MPCFSNDVHTVGSGTPESFFWYNACLSVSNFSPKHHLCMYGPVPDYPTGVHHCTYGITTLESNCVTLRGDLEHRDHLRNLGTIHVPSEICRCHHSPPHPPEGAGDNRIPFRVLHAVSIRNLPNDVYAVWCQNVPSGY